MPKSLSGQFISDWYTSLLHVSSVEMDPTTLNTLFDGEGNTSSLTLAVSGVSLETSLSTVCIDVFQSNTISTGINPVPTIPDVEYIKIGATVTGSVTADDFVGGKSLTSRQAKDTIDLIYPLNSVYTTTENINPSAIFCFTEWELLDCCLCCPKLSGGPVSTVGNNCYDNGLNVYFSVDVSGSMDPDIIKFKGGFLNMVRHLQNTGQPPLDPQEKKALSNGKDITWGNLEAPGAGIRDVGVGITTFGGPAGLVSEHLPIENVYPSYIGQQRSLDGKSWPTAGQSSKIWLSPYNANLLHAYLGLNPWQLGTGQEYGGASIRLAVDKLIAYSTSLPAGKAPPNIIVHVTDDISADNIVDAAKYAASYGVQVFTINLVSPGSVSIFKQAADELSEVANTTGGYYWSIYQDPPINIPRSSDLYIDDTAFGLMYTNTYDSLYLGSPNTYPRYDSLKNFSSPPFPGSGRYFYYMQHIAREIIKIVCPGAPLSTAISTVTPATSGSKTSVSKPIYSWKRVS